MKIGIIGMPRAGKTTVFEALSKNIQNEGHRVESRLATIAVPDQRVDILSDMYQPKKTIYAQVEYFLSGMAERSKDAGPEQSIWNQVRDCDALIHVVRNFGGFGFDDPTPEADFRKIEEELVFADLVVAEKRLERLKGDQKRGKKIDPEEEKLISECHRHLENEEPLRIFPELAESPRLRGFTFLSAKPQLVLFNNPDEVEDPPEGVSLSTGVNPMVIRAKLEQELAQMTEEEASEFLSEFGIAESAADRVIAGSYELLGLISFFTVGDDEVRAWTIGRGTKADDAADTIHSDMKKGFIRAEVVGYQDLMDAGNYAEARKKGTVRLEGKTYEVQDGDIMSIRFNV